MKIDKATPGPWFIPTTMGSSGGVAHASGYVCFTGAPRKVDEARQPGESWLDMHNRTAPERAAIAAEESANARLIAASPTMADYLRELAGAGDTRAAAILESIDAAR